MFTHALRAFRGPAVAARAAPGVLPHAARGPSGHREARAEHARKSSIFSVVKKCGFFVEFRFATISKTFGGI